MDARRYQILFLFLFLLLGIGNRDWTLHPGMIGGIILTCGITQVLAEAVKQQLQTGFLSPAAASRLFLDLELDSGLDFKTEQPTRSSQGFSTLWHTLKSSLPSALITSLGLSLLLRADHYSTILLASTLAILSKFLLRFNDKHIFNPANFGIVAVLLLTPDAWVSPGQWGDEGWYALLFLGAGGLVLQKVGRWDTTVAFLSTYAGLEAIRNLWLGWTWDVWAHRLISGSLLLFALFMITDPRTLPNARIGRLIWAGAIALLTFILRNGYFISSAVFWALFALAPLSILLDRIFPAPRFVWVSPLTPEPFALEHPAPSIESVSLPAHPLP
jgi:Na+-transporting NADH:ubiquinone oxidoreductase subunit NqrB